MIRLLPLAVALALLATASHAESPRPTQQRPEILALPSADVGRLLQFFGDPHIAGLIPLYQSDVAPLLTDIQNCVHLQVEGVAPANAAACSREKEVTDLKKRLADASPAP